MERYSLNLSPRYAASWGAWEVAREILCNAIDAAPDGMKVVVEGANELRVTTPTVPDLSELFIIGEGTKCEGGKTIGQFGEGVKLAALVAARTEGGSLVLNVPGRTIMFAFDDVMGVQVLHASVEDNPLHEFGYEAVIQMPGVSMAFAGRLLDDRTPGPREKPEQKGCRVFCKGVFVTDLSNDSIWNWNLDGLKINRDRSMVNTSEVTYSIREWLQANITPEIADTMLSNPDTLESDNVLAWMVGGKTVEAMRAAFARRHGEKSCIGTGIPKVDAQAERQGYTVAQGISAGMESCLRNAGVPKSDKVIPKGFDFEQVDGEPYRAQLAELKKLDSIIAAPGCGVFIYANREESRKGMAIVADRRIWLSQSLFSEGNELELVRTYLHEMAHLICGHDDETAEFEFALDGIAGRLGVQVLSGRSL